MAYLDLIKMFYDHPSDPKNRCGWGWLCESTIRGGAKGNGIKMGKFGQNDPFFKVKLVG